MKNYLKFLFLVSFTILLFAACKDDDDTTIPAPTCDEKIEELKINQLQVIGSHNSYRQRTHAPILQYLFDNLAQLPPGFTPIVWDYDHVSLDEQFSNYGIRSIELDVYNDPNGGLFYYRIGNGSVMEDPNSNEPKLLEPGLKIMHFPDLDYNTHYLTFKDAITAVKNWSASNPNHVPISIMVETKEDSPNALLGDPFTVTIPFDKIAMESIDQEIMDVFGTDLTGVLTPDDLRGTHASVNEAVLANDWPTLGDARGKVMFILSTNDDMKAAYLDGHATLENRAMFVFSDAGNPETAFVKKDDPVANEASIKTLVGEGYIVRTRADANTLEARSGETQRRDAALGSGAQIVSTDYYKADGRADWSDYTVELPDGAAARISTEFIESVDLTCGVKE
jgi:hypothetical protein